MTDPDPFTTATEHRAGRSPSDPSTVITGNGGHICSMDAGFLAVATRAVLEMRLAELAAA